MPIARMLFAAAIAGLFVTATAMASQGAAQDQRAAAAKAVSAKTQTPLKTAVAVSRRYWGTLPCNGRIKFITRSPSAPGVHHAADAWATFASPLGANNLAAPASSYTNCAIALAPRRWPTRASMVEDWNILCATIVHEMGHLHGHAHDSTPGHIMVPVFTDGSSVPSICRKTRPRPDRVRRR